MWVNRQRKLDNASIVCEWIEYDVSKYLQVGKNICKEIVCDSASVFEHVFVRGKASNLVSNLCGNGAQAHFKSSGKWHSYIFRIALAQHSTGVEIYCFACNGNSLWMKIEINNKNFIWIHKRKCQKKKIE